MNASPIRHILFDLGGTLMHARADWAPVYARADQLLAETLRQYDIDLDQHFFRSRLHQYYKQREQDFQETTYHFVLRELLKELGYIEVAESVLRAALDALYSVTQTNWQLEIDALETLQELRAKNYRLGIFSNAGDDKDVQELVANFGIRENFDFVLTSAACYYRKPHPRAFEIALAQWSIPPGESVMVGDSLAADIFGARQLKMRTFWLTRRAQFTPDEEQRIRPDFRLSELNELVPALEQVNR